MTVSREERTRRGLLGADAKKRAVDAGLHVPVHRATASEAWQHLTRLVGDGAPKDAVKAARMEFEEALSRYDRVYRV